MRELLHLMIVMHEEIECANLQGRPRINIEKEQLCFLMESGFRVTDVAAIFACCRRTIERHLQEFGIRSCDYSTISDTELDELIHSIVVLHPQSGEKTVTGQLRSQGHRLQ